MSTELARIPRQSLDQKINYSTQLATANLLPSSYRSNPGNVLMAVELGEALGVPTITAITSVHVIEGKPSASAGR